MLCIMVCLDLLRPLEDPCMGEDEVQVPSPLAAVLDYEKYHFCRERGGVRELVKIGIDAEPSQHRSPSDYEDGVLHVDRFNLSF